MVGFLHSFPSIAFITALTLAGPAYSVPASSSEVSQSTSSVSLIAADASTVSSSSVAQASTAPSPANLAVSNPTASAAAFNGDACGSGDFTTSGAASMMSQWLQANGTTNWLSEMEAVFGGPSNGGLDCRSISSNTCTLESNTLCTSFEFPQFFFIQKSAVNANAFFKAAHTAIVDGTIIEGFSVDQIVSDFVVDANNPPKLDIFDKLSTGFALAGGVLPFLGPDLDAASAGINILGAIFGVINSHIPDPPDGQDSTQELTTLLSNFVANTASNALSTILSFNDGLFGGDSNLDLSNVINVLQQLGGNYASSIKAETSGVSGGAVISSDNQNVTTILEVFEPGFFLTPQDGDSVIQTALTNGVQLIKQQMAGLIIEAQGFFIYVDTTISDLQSCANSGFGARFLNNQCFRLVGVQGGNSGPSIQAAPNQLEGKFDDGTSGYNIDPGDFFLNADACVPGSGQTIAGAIDSNFPHCLFSLPVVKVAGGDPCNTSNCFVTNEPGSDGVEVQEVECVGGYPDALLSTCKGKTDRGYPFRG